jgi:tripartite-type tricarboxylate transporter receptor subunit TctC
LPGTLTRRSFGIALAALAIQAGASHAQTDPVADFYRGKTVTILVGYQAGGGYDLYARIVAQFLGKHIPGQPAVIVQNMPGAGGLRAARNLASVAAKDGTVLGMLAQTLPFDTVLGYTPDIDAAKFTWIGRAAMNVEVGVAFAKSGIASIEDARKREITSGGTGGTASSTVVPFLLNKLAGTRFKLVAGYRSANEALLAMERGEIDMVGATGISTIIAKHGDRLKDGTVRLIYQSALTRHSAIPNVPTIGEVATGKEERQILDLFSSGSAIGRALIAPPGLPADRTAALRRAMAATLADPELVALARKGNLMLEPGSAEELDGIVRTVLATPKSVAEKAKDVLESLKTQR